MVLVLTRKINEQIVIDDNIIITVVRIEGNRVALGIEAPENIPIHRKEYLEKKGLLNERLSSNARERAGSSSSANSGVNTITSGDSELTKSDKQSTN